MGRAASTRCWAHLVCVLRLAWFQELRAEVCNDHRACVADEGQLVRPRVPLDERGNVLWLIVAIGADKRLHRQTATKQTSVERVEQRQKLGEDVLCGLCVGGKAEGRLAHQWTEWVLHA
eukprot:355670-Chlamydomonas_euryale.AAC.6